MTFYTLFEITYKLLIVEKPPISNALLPIDFLEIKKRKEAG